MGLHLDAHLVLLGKDRMTFEMDGGNWLWITKQADGRRILLSLDKDAAINLLNDLGIAVQAQWGEDTYEPLYPEGAPVDPAKLNVGKRCDYLDGDTRCLYCQGHAGPHEMATSEEYPWEAPILDVQG